MMDGVLQKGKLTMNVLTLLFLRMTLWCFLGAMTLHAEQKPQEGYFDTGVENKITQVLHHKGPLVHEVVHYCKAAPVINHIPDADWQKQQMVAENPSVERYRFFMPYTSMDTKKFQDVMLELAQQDGYSITFTPTNTPTKGLSCIVQIDPTKIGFQVETFETITGAKAVAFKFLQRDNMKRINTKSHPIIRTAQAAAGLKKNYMLS